MDREIRNGMVALILKKKQIRKMNPGSIFLCFCRIAQRQRIIHPEGEMLDLIGDVRSMNVETKK